MPLVILTVILPDSDATRVPWGINPRHVTEVAHHQHPDLCTVAIVRGARTEAHTVLGSVAAVVAMLNRDPDALAALDAGPDDTEPCRLCNVPMDDHEAHQPERLADRHTFAGPDEDRAALDRIAALLRFPEWPGASAIEDVAAIVATVRNIEEGPTVTEWRSH